MSTEAIELEIQQGQPSAVGSAVENVNTAVAKFDRVAAGLADLKSRYNGVLFDVTTTKGMKDATAARAAIRGVRVEVEKVRKECKAPVLALGKEIDARAAAITPQLLALEDPIDAQIKAEEDRREAEKQRKAEAERSRIAAIQSRIDEIKSVPASVANASAAEIMEADRALSALVINHTFAEFQNAALEAREYMLTKLRQMHAGRVAHEDEQERLRLERAELARQKAAQDEANRIERERMAAEQAEAERQRIEREVERQRLIDEQMAKLRAERAEHERLAREQQAQRDREDAERREAQQAEDDRRAAAQRRQQEQLQREQDMQRARWGEIDAMGHQVMIASTGRAGVREGGTRECIAETLAETVAWQVTEEKFGWLYPVAVSARQTAIDAITRELQAWDARAEAERVAAEQAAATAAAEVVALVAEATEPDAPADVSSSDEAEFCPTANDIAQLVSSEYGVDFQQALVWCFNAFDSDVILAQRRKEQEGGV